MNSQNPMKQLLLSLVILGVGYGIAQHYLFNTWNEELNARQAGIAELKRDNDVTDRYRIERDTLQAQVAEARTRYARVERLLPSEEALGELFNDFKVQARQARLVLEKKDDTHAAYKPGLNESPITLQLRGSFPNHLSFLSWLSKHPRVMVFNSQEIKSNGFDTTMTLKGFAPLDVPKPETTQAGNAVQTAQLSK